MSTTNQPPSLENLHRTRIALVADASMAHRKVLAMQLARSGYRVEEAGTGNEALSIYHQTAPEIVFCDWAFPDMSSVEFIAEIRRIPKPDFRYIVLLKAEPNKREITYGLQNGADDFLRKPVSSPDLMIRLVAAERMLQMQSNLRSSNTRLIETIDQMQKIRFEHEKQLNDARMLQEGLLQESNRRLGLLDVSLLLQPAGHVGGDLVGFFPIDARRVGVYAIDVSGHGIAAAMLTARLAAYLNGPDDQNVALRITPLGLYDARPPAELVSYFNKMILTEMRTETYMTMAYAEIDFLTGTGRLVQAGHPYPLIQRATGEIESVGQGGLPVGVFEKASYQEVAFKLKPGDRLFIASDGITEAHSPAGNLLGDQGLKAIMQTNAFLRGKNMLESLSWSINGFSAGVRCDDISAILLEYGHEQATAPRSPQMHPLDLRAS